MKWQTNFSYKNNKTKHKSSWRKNGEILLNKTETCYFNVKL